MALVPTGRSEELRAIARSLVAELPDDAADEVVLTGSVSRGVADDGSDVELLLVVPRLPHLTVADVWARTAGVEPTSPWESAELVYVAGHVQDTSVELVWLEEAKIEALLEAAFAGRLVDHARLRSLEALEHGTPLRGGHRLRGETPDVSSRVARGARPRRGRRLGGYAVAAYTRQAGRSDRYSNARVVLEVADDVLRLLFTLNRRWEPSWKRIPELVAPLPLKPDRTAERIGAALAASDPRLALLTIFELARDAVALVEPELAVSRARALDEAAATVTTVLALDAAPTGARAGAALRQARRARWQLPRERYATTGSEEVARLVLAALAGEHADGTSCFAYSLVAADRRASARQAEYADRSRAHPTR